MGITRSSYVTVLVRALRGCIGISILFASDSIQFQATGVVFQGIRKISNRCVFVFLVIYPICWSMIVSFKISYCISYYLDGVQFR